MSCTRCQNLTIIINLTILQLCSSPWQHEMPVNVDYTTITSIVTVGKQIVEHRTHASCYCYRKSMAPTTVTTRTVNRSLTASADETITSSHVPLLLLLIRNRRLMPEKINDVPVRYTSYASDIVLCIVFIRHFSVKATFRYFHRIYLDVRLVRRNSSEVTRYPETVKRLAPVSIKNFVELKMGKFCRGTHMIWCWVLSGSQFTVAINTKE